MFNMTIDDTDFMYPLLMDIYYPIVDQGAYGNLSRRWVFDRTVACGFGSGSRKNKQDVQPDPDITIDNSIVGRTREDITQSNRDKLSSVTNILVANIRDTQGNIIYNESSGPRVGKSTVFEIATINPTIGLLGSTEYYRLVLRRSDNQAVDV